MSTYKEMSDRLEQLLQELQSGELDIDEAIDKHNVAQELLAEMQKYLKTAKNKISKNKKL